MTINSKAVQPVILSGGSGTRLWPLSSETLPKQFLALTGKNTMLQATVRRVAGQTGFATPVIVARADHREVIEQQLATIGMNEARLILEPAARNTAPAIALAALRAQPDTILLIMPSDHVIAGEKAFRVAIDAALPTAQKGFLITFGIKPDSAETGYGYIQRGEALAPALYRAVQFVEKPDASTARRYVADGGYSWNAGIFLFRAGDYLQALANHAPEIFEACSQANAQGTSEGECFHPDKDSFCRSPSISIDYAVIEKADRVAVMPVDIGWSDIGSWDALLAWLKTKGESGSDGEDNIIIGNDSVQIGAHGCFIRSTGPAIAAIGVENLIIVATGDAVLIVPRGESQRAKEAVERLRRKAE